MQFSHMGFTVFGHSTHYISYFSCIISRPSSHFSMVKQRFELFQTRSVTECFVLSNFSFDKKQQSSIMTIQLHQKSDQGSRCSKGANDTRALIVHGKPHRDSIFSVIQLKMCIHYFLEYLSVKLPPQITFIICMCLCLILP